MPIDMKFIDDAKMLATVLSGRVTFRDLLAHNGDVQQMLASREVEIRIMDLSGLTDPDISSDQILELAETNRDVIHEHPVKDMLVIASQDVQYGLCRMWEAFGGFESDALKIFRTAQEADEYLNKHHGISLPPFFKPV